ncbi:MAG: ABC transporter permease [Bacteroidota bacterium]
MIKNYFLISFRNLRKHLGYTVINIFGLGMGLATCLLLVIWIMHELSYDKFHEKADRIYRVSLEYSFGGQTSKTPVSPNALLPALLTLPETESGVRVYNQSAWTPYIVRNNEKMFQESRFYTADSTFFKVFSFQLTEGNPEKALTEPYSVILTESMAKKYFGNEDPMGKQLQVNNKQYYTVTGLMGDVPSNSHIKFDFLASFNSIRAGREEPTWWSANYQTFVVIQPHANLDALKNKINEIVKKAVANEVTGENDYVRYAFMPFTDIYLKSDYDGEPEVVSDIKYMYIFSAVALLVLVIACINYINLATARASDRAKEVGIRKVVGALRNQLFTQFIGESLIITIFAFCFAIFLAHLALPFFNDLTGKNFSYTILLQPGFLSISVAALLIIALLSGAYPAFAITAFKPVSILKGNFKSSAKGIWLRKSLVILQFGISVILITGTLVIVKQLDFIQGRKLGYDKENVIMLPMDSKTSEVFETLQTELLRNGTARNIARASESPTNVLGGYSINVDDAKDPGIITTGLLVDESFIPVFNMELIDGRNFTKADRERVARDTVYTFIINETTRAALFGDQKDVVGKKADMGYRKGEIIGVVKDFHFASLHSNIGPLVMFPEEAQFDKILIKLPEGDLKLNLDKIKNTWSTLVPHRPFEFEFLDQQYSRMYHAEGRMSAVFIVFATLAIMIACLGLLGLVSFSAAQKTKEIGIRKVLGATASNIVLLITKDFTKLILVSIALGLPLAYWMMSQWLKDFAYKTDIGPEPILISSLLCMTIAFGTAGFQAVKAALIDPARTLRNE